MNKFDVEIKKISSQILLSQEEKSRLRAHIMRFTQLYPLTEKKTSPHPSFSGGMRVFFLHPFPVALVLFLFVGGSISFAAEGALPGNLLYPIKVAVNEEVRGALTFSTEAKTEWELERVERRLEEAVALSAADSTSPEAQEEAAKQFEKYANKITAHIETIKEKDPERASELNSQIETSVEAHEELLERLSSRKIASRTPVLDKIRDRKLASASGEPMLFEAATFSMEMSTRSEKGSGVQAPATQDVAFSNEPAKISAVRLRQKAEIKISESQNLISRFENKLSSTTITRAQSDLVLAKDLFKEGTTAFEEGRYQDALSSFQSAFTISLKLSIILNAEKVYPALSESDDNATLEKEDVEEEFVEQEKGGEIEMDNEESDDILRNLEDRIRTR